MNDQEKRVGETLGRLAVQAAAWTGLRAGEAAGELKKAIHAAKPHAKRAAVEAKGLAGDICQAFGEGFKKTSQEKAKEERRRDVDDASRG